MTTPLERSKAVLHTVSFLQSLIDHKLTPRVPMAVREEARKLIKHYPSQYDMMYVEERFQPIFGYGVTKRHVDEDASQEKRVLNLTQHPGTPEQGVIEPRNKTLIRELLTFTNAPTADELQLRAQKLAQEAICHDCTHVLIGGAPYFMAPLEQALRYRNLIPVYSFSERVSVETQQPDGTVQKTNVFKHQCFIETE